MNNYIFYNMIIGFFTTSSIFLIFTNTISTESAENPDNFDVSTNNNYDSKIDF